MLGLHLNIVTTTDEGELHAALLGTNYVCTGHSVGEAVGNILTQAAVDDITVSADSVEALVGYITRLFELRQEWLQG